MTWQQPWEKLCHVSAGFTSCCQPFNLAYVKSFEAFLQSEASEQLAKTILAAAGPTGVEELDLRGAALKQTLLASIATSDAKAAGITSLHRQRITTGFCGRRPIRTQLANSFPHSRKRTKMRPERRLVCWRPRSARLARTSFPSKPRSTHSSKATWAQMRARTPPRPRLR